MADGQAELIEVLRYIGGRAEDLQCISEHEVVHAALLGKVAKAKGERLRDARGMEMINTVHAKKEDRLQEAAKQFLLAGEMREYCEIMFALGSYKKALAFAPSVSIEYWQELTERHTRVLEEEQSLEAPLAAIVSSESDKAVRILRENGEVADAKVVKAISMTGAFAGVLSKVKSKAHGGQEESKGFDLGDEQLGHIIERESDLYFYQGKTLLAAAAYLTVNNYKRCLQILVRSQELYLALHIAKRFMPEAVKEIALRLAERAEKYF